MKTIQKVVYKCEICGKEFERISEAVADEANCKMKQQEENKTKTPAFEIGFDTITNKYKVYNQTNERLSNEVEALRVALKDAERQNSNFQNY